MKIINLLNNAKENNLDLRGLQPETIMTMLGMENIADDQVEDLQYYIDQAKEETDALMAEARAEFGY